MSRLNDQDFRDPEAISQVYGDPRPDTYSSPGEQQYYWDLEDGGSLSWFTNVQGRLTVTFTDSEHQWHREDGPARLTFYPTGQLEERSYYIHGSPASVSNRPSYERFNEDGSLTNQSWYRDGQLSATTSYHEDGRTSHGVLLPDGNWRHERRENGLLHSEHGPAVIVTTPDRQNVEREFWLRGQLVKGTADDFVIDASQAQRSRQAFELAGGIPNLMAGSQPSTPSQRPAHMTPQTLSPSQKQGRTL